MARKTSISAAALVLPRDHGELGDFVRIIGDLQRERQNIKAGADKRVAEIAAEAAKDIAPIAEQIAGKVAAVHAYCAAYRVPLTDHGATKTIKLATGELCWRTQPPSVSISKKKAAAVIAALKGLGAKFKKFIRTKDEIDKDAMLADQELAKTVPGVKFVTGAERFYVKPLELDLEEVAP